MTTEQFILALIGFFSAVGGGGGIWAYVSSRSTADAGVAIARLNAKDTRDEQLKAKTEPK